MAASMPLSNVHISKHPCLAAKISQLRSHSASARETKLLTHEIATILGCEALAEALSVVDDGDDVSPLNYPFKRNTISPSKICLVPILRSGLSMVDGVLSILPTAVPVHHLGMYREKSTLQPVEYYNNLPYHRPIKPSSDPSGLARADFDTAAINSAASDLAIVVDPVIATGSTMCAAIETLKEWGVKKILCLSILASEEGLKRAREEGGATVSIWVGEIDAETDSRGMIKPGLGDVGDRLFLTMGK